MAGFTVAIIGCGMMGKQHMAGWTAREDSSVVSVCDPIEERRAALAESTGAKAYPEFHEAILHEGVNIVSVCTPVCFHSEISCFAAENGRHVLCEKPLALTLDQADAMIRAARENRVLLSTSFQYRGAAKNQEYRRLFREGAFGRPVFLRYSDIREVRPKLAMHRCSMNGGPVIDMAGHYFDMMRFLTGEEPVSVYAQGHIFGKGKERLAGIEDLAIDAADVQVGMSSGSMLQALVDWGMPEGYAGFSDEILVGPLMSVHPAGEGLELVTSKGRETLALGPNPPGSSARINDLADAIRERRQPEVTGEDGRIALRVSLAALESIETGKVVTL